MVTSVDTNVVVAAVQGWHREHERARRALDSVLADTVILAQHVLFESYSVLTRLPAPHRLAPEAAFELLSSTFRSSTRIAGLDAEGTWTLLAELPADGVAGGTAYDALILRTVVDAGARRFLTFNLRHFERLAPAGLEIVEP